MARLAAVLLVAAAGCGRSPAPPAGWFEDATARLGVRFAHSAGPPDDYLMSRAMGPGAPYSTPGGMAGSTFCSCKTPAPAPS